MTVHNEKYKAQSDRGTELLVFLFLFTACSVLPGLSFAEQKWPGVDRSVVEKFANEHGREARQPLINTDQGDLLLFVFLIAGAVGGFAAGYYWRILTAEKKVTLKAKPGPRPVSHEGTETDLKMEK